MHGLDEVEARNKKDDEVGAFAFMHPASAATESDEVCFALCEDEVEEAGHSSLMEVKMHDEKDSGAREVALALCDDEDKMNTDPSDLTVEMIHHESNEVEDEDVASVEATYHDARSENSDSTYYDETKDHDLDSFFDEDDVLVSPPSPVPLRNIIDLTKSTSSSEGDASKVARMPTNIDDSEEERYRKGQLFSDTSDDDVEDMLVKNDEDCDRKIAAEVDKKNDQEVEDAAKTPEELVPDLGIIDALMMGEESLMPGEQLMHPSDRDRAIVSYHLDELTNEAAWDMDDEVTVGSGSNRPLAIMSTVDPALVRRMDLAIVINDETALDALFGAVSNNNESDTSDVSLMASEKQALKLVDLHVTKHLVFDTGGTTHSMKSKKAASNVREASGREVVAFDGRAMQIQCRFDMSGDVLDKNNKHVSTLNLTNVSYMPESRFNLFSASQAIKQGWTGQIDANSARLTKGTSVLTFDRLVPTGTSMLYALRLVPRGTQESGAVAIDGEENNERHKTN